jgi:hypothetical protein
MRPSPPARSPNWIPPGLVWLGLLLLSIGLLAPGAYREINVYDEGVAVYGAERVLHGEVPYRDFWTIYAPGDLYLLAALFKTFGPRLIVERHAWVLLDAVLAVLVYAIARRAGNRAWAILCWSLTILWTRQIPIFGSPGIPALVCLCGAILVTLRFLNEPRPRLWLRPGPRRDPPPHLLMLAGVLVAICTLFRQDFGLYACVSIMATLVYAGRASLANIASFLGAAAIGLTPAVIALLVAVPRERLIEHLVTFPLTIYPRMRALPLPALPGSPVAVLTGAVAAGAYLREQARAVQFYGSLVMLAGLTLWSLFVRVRRGNRSAMGTVAFLIGTTGLLLFEHARVRSDLYHLYPAFLFTLIASAIVMSACEGWGRGWVYRLITAGTVLAVLTIAVVTARTERAAEARQTPLAIPRAAGLFTLDAPGADAYVRAIAEVQRRVPPGQPIFVGNTRHDRLIINEVLFYFLSERPSATAYHDMHPGVVTTVAVQEAMVRDIESTRVSCVVLHDDPQRPPEPGNDSGVSSGVTMLDQYIRGHFVPGPRFDDYQVWERRP